MFGGDTNPMFFGPIDNVGVPYNYANSVPPMHFDVLAGSNGGIINASGTNNAFLNYLPIKLGTEAPIFPPQKVPVSLNGGIGQDEGGSKWKQFPVSTGLKLSYGEDEYKSSISSVGESTMINLSSGLSHHDNLQTELFCQTNELDQCIRMQEENLRKGIAQLKRHHTISLLSALEEDINCKIREKDTMIQNLNLKNEELVDKIHKLANVAQSWHDRAKRNESLVNTLRTNITEVTQQAGAVVKEGNDENMIDVLDDAVSSCNVQLPPSVSRSLQETVNYCKSCKMNGVSVLLLPCRHLCLCADCEAFVEICPVCRAKKVESLQVCIS